LTPAEADARYPEDGGRHHTFLFAIDDGIVIDAAVDGNEARFINHSCDPNCDALVERERIWIETIRDIDPGEELAYDYAYELEERHTPAAKRRYPCSCGAEKCRGTILAKKR
jgi:SET domain-containing protein